MPCPRFAVPGLEEGQLGVDHDGRKDVVEIVGDAAGQGPQGLDLLGPADEVVSLLDLGGPLPHELFQVFGRPAEDLFGGLPLGDVLDDAGHDLQASPGVPLQIADLHPDHPEGTVRAHDPEFHGRLRPLCRSGPDQWP